MHASQGLDTRQRLLLTAMHLYAAEGLHAVSLRRISAEAGSKNSAAMHYHFQNKIGVVQALVELIAMELRHIDAQLREGQPSPGSLRESCRNTLRPLAQRPRPQIWGAVAVGFISRLVC
jgi:AcrR family transcriptional regulator